MSRKQVVEETEDDISPEQLIDTQENKPKVAQEAEPEKHEMKLELKNVGKLTEEERNYLINLYQNGGEHEFYKVHFYKNGTNKITRKKQPPKYNTTKRLLEQEQLRQLQQSGDKPYMTTEQILMEHVIDLEAKYATLYQKHKKLKKNYKELHEDIYFDENDGEQATMKQTTKPKHDEEPQEDEQEEEQQQTQFSVPQQSYNIDNNNYINKLRRPQKGYRRMMAGLM